MISGELWQLYKQFCAIFLKSVFARHQDYLQIKSDRGVLKMIIEEKTILRRKRARRVRHQALMLATWLQNYLS